MKFLSFILALTSFSTAFATTDVCTILKPGKEVGEPVAIFNVDHSRFDEQNFPSTILGFDDKSHLVKFSRIGFYKVDNGEYLLDATSPRYIHATMSRMSLDGAHPVAELGVVIPLTTGAPTYIYDGQGKFVALIDCKTVKDRESKK
jgi:hypothetical protein